MLDLDPVTGGAFFLHLIVLGQAADDAEALTAAGPNVEFCSGHFALFDKRHVHPGLASSWHGNLEPF